MEKVEKKKKWLEAGRNCSGHWKYQLLNSFHLYLQSKVNYDLAGQVLYGN